MNNKWDFVPIPKEMRLGMNYRNLYKVVGKIVHFLAYDRSIEMEDEFTIHSVA